MYLSRWLLVIYLALSWVAWNVELKPGISASHGKILASSGVSHHGPQGMADTSLNTNGGRAFVHDKGAFVVPRTEPPIPPKLLCPKSFDLVGDNCVFVQTIPASVECPQGFQVLKRELSIECVKVNLVNAKFECPNGVPPKFSEESAFCPSEYFENPSISCPSGTVQKGNECVTTDTKPPILRCSEGYSLDDSSNCKQVIEHKPMLSCPPETILEKTSMTCVAKVIVEPLEVCPPGAIPVKSRDLNDIKGLLNRIADGRERTQQRSLQEIPTLGSLRSEGGVSAQRSSALSGNFTNSGGDRERTSTSGKTESHTVSASRNAEQPDKSTWSSGSGGQPRPTQTSGDQRESQHVVSSGKAESYPRVSGNYEGREKQEEQVDTFYQALYDSSRDLRNSGGIINESLLGDEIVCLILQFTTPHVECPPGLELSKDGICSHYDTFTPKKTCEGGIEPDSDNMCVIEKLLPAEVECPKDYTLDIISGMCVKKEIEELLCPEGTTLNKATIKCEANPRCPDSFVMNNSTMACEKEKSVPPHPKCPEETEYDEESDSCKVKDAQLPLIMCPEGYEQRGDDCVLEKHIPASFYCPPDYYQTNKNACVKWHQDYMLQCPQFLELREESFAYRADLIPPPGAGRGPVVPFVGIGRRLQEQRGGPSRYPDSRAGKREYDGGGQPRGGEGWFESVQNSREHAKKRFESLGSQTPVVIRSYKTRDMVCFGWGRRYKMVVNCPEGTTLLNERCVETRITEPDSVCTKGYTFNEAAMLCEYEERAMPSVGCPPFMSLTTSAGGSHVCLGNKREPAEVICPNGFEWVANSFSCQLQEFAQPKMGCVKGYSIVKERTGTFCQRRDTMSPTPSCPLEYRYDDVNKICIYEVKLHEVRERSEYMQSALQNVRTNL